MFGKVGRAIGFSMQEICDIRNSLISLSFLKYEQIENYAKKEEKAMMISFNDMIKRIDYFEQ